MLDFTNQLPDTGLTLFGQALAFGMSNGTDDGQFGRKAVQGDPITACLDSKRQKIVPLGEYYYADSCTLCLCSNAESMCKQISCAPPEKCDGYLQKEPMHCCDVCVPAVVVERPYDQSSMNMKLGALTVALFLIISLVLFTLHRMRRKRVMVALRRLQSLRRRDSTCSESRNGSNDRRNSLGVLEGELFSSRDPRVFLSNDRATIISECPPPYSAAVTLPRPPETLARAPPRCTAPAEPPPAYNQAMQEGAAVGRCPSQNGHNGRHSRTSDYPDDADEEDGDARSTTSCGTSSGSSSSASSLSSSQDSLDAIDDDAVDGEDDEYCSCSHCDSGLSEERCSLSSNDVRPRSEILANVSAYHLSLTQSSSQHLLQQTSLQPQTSTLDDTADNNGRGRRGRQSADGVGNHDERRKNRGKQCKKKLKKLMMKAKRKAGRGRRNGNGNEESTSGVTSANTEITRGQCPSIEADATPVTSL